MPELITFPRRLVARTTNLRLINRTRSSQESLSGFVQVAASVAQRWALTLEFNTLKRENVLAYRAIIAALEGKANHLRVPIVDSRLWPEDAALGLEDVPHSDGTPFDDGTLYSAGDIAGVYVNALKGSKRISVDMGAFGEAFTAGQYFGIGDELYICTRIWWEGSVATVDCQPGLRRDHSGSPFRLRPVLVCQLAEDEVGDHPLEWGIRTSPTLDLREVL
jgi:hypothetical protein